MDLELRPYQKECLAAIEAQPPGAYLCQMPTGCGKTATFTHIPRQGQVLVLAHRDELVHQPAKYYDCPVGFEIGKERSHGEEVVIASVQSLVHRLDRFAPDAFDMIITDEAHHAPAKTYKKIYQHFTPRLHLGFTATPGRSDHVRLDDIFSKIIFQRDLPWAIKSGYLCDIRAIRTNIGYDLSAVHSRMGDYAPGELEKAMDGTEDAIAQAYRKYAKGPTIIFAASVDHANKIAEKIPKAAVVTGETTDRASIIQRFTNGEIPVIVNVMVFTEGTDIPCIETGILARPTQSESLYTQMVGRILRPYPGKEKAILIDCVGTTGKASLCTAPTLLGIDMSLVPAEKRDEIEGDLFELPELIERASDCPQSWIKNIQIVDLWAKENKYDTRGINFFKMPDGRLVVSLKNNQKITIPATDALGQITCNNGNKITMQEAIDAVYKRLLSLYQDERYIWDTAEVKRWGNAPASEGQMKLVRRMLKDKTPPDLTKGQASQILNRMFADRKSG